MRFLRIFFLSVFVVIGCMMTTSFVLADETVRGVLNQAAPSAGLTNICNGSSCIPPIIGGLIKVAISFLGVALIGYILYGGYLWMTAGGEGKQIEEAQKVIRNAVIGVFLVGFSYTLAGGVLRLVTETLNPPAPPPAQTILTEPVTEQDDLQIQPLQLNPFVAGCTRSECASTCIPQRCTNLTGQRRFTCETGCQNECQQRCGVDGRSTPSEQNPNSCEWLTGSALGTYRQCLANCNTDINERSQRGDYRTREERVEALQVCNNDCTYLHCRR